MLTLTAFLSKRVCLLYRVQTRPTSLPKSKDEQSIITIHDTIRINMSTFSSFMLTSRLCIHNIKANKQCDAEQKLKPKSSLWKR